MTVPRNALAVLIVGLSLTGLGLWYGLFRRTTSAATTAATALKAAQTSARATSPRTDEPHQGIADSKAATPATSSATEYSRAFRESTNYRNFILSALPAAQKGDRDAQYYLSAALEYCDSTYRFFFRRREKTLSVDEAIAERSALGDRQYIEAIRRADGRCHQVYDATDPTWGSADQWLATATDAEQPVAQARMAEKIFVEITRTGKAGVPTPGSPGEIRTMSDARSLLRAAVESKNVEAIFEIGALLPVLKPGLPNSDYYAEQLTWEYAACFRGMDCGVNAEWHLQTCLVDPRCLPGESGIDYLRRSAHSNMIDLEQKASDLNDKLDAEAWDALGLGG